MIDDTLRPLIVAKKTDEAHNMVSFELVDPNGAELPAFSARSHIDITIPGGLVRQYSLCNSTSERNRYVVGVWNDGNGRGGSKALHGQAHVGDTLQVGLPQNIPFELHYVFAMMSPGSFLGMIKESNFAANTKFYFEASELNQLLNPAAILADQPEDMQLFICGVDWWQDPIINTAKQKGWAEERIHVERFTAKVPAAILDKVFDVKIASTGTVYKIPGDKTVTAFLEEKGVKIPTSCEQGMCGTCKIKVLEGEIDHRDKRLSPQQKEEGFFLACVSRAKSDLLVLDL